MIRLHAFVDGSKPEGLPLVEVEKALREALNGFELEMDLDENGIDAEVQITLRLAEEN